MLLPCPFCGCDKPEEQSSCVVCPSCGVRVHSTPDRNFINAWNYRGFKLIDPPTDKIYMANSHVADSLHSYETASGLADKHARVNEPCLILKVIEKVELISKPEIKRTRIY